MKHEEYTKTKKTLDKYEKVAKENGFTYVDSGPYHIYDTKHRGQFDYFYDWRDACLFYGLV